MNGSSADAAPNRTALAGYACGEYARSLAGFGEPVELPGCGGWLLERPIPGTAYADAIGPYPLFACRDWSRLAADLEAAGDAWVSVSLVPDPFGEFTPELLRQTFPDLVRPFKEHFVVDLRQEPGKYVCKHHRRNARRALNDNEVERIAEPDQTLDEWDALYQELVARHAIRGLPVFSRQAFAGQLATPGMVAFRAACQGETAGMALFFATDKAVFYHLAAYNETGYRMRASFALFWRAIEYFSDTGAVWLNLGGGAGLGGGEDGLTRFKRGWATDTRQAYFCGRICQPRRYAELSSQIPSGRTDYFPAYRQGEFA